MGSEARLSELESYISLCPDNLVQNHVYSQKLLLVKTLSHKTGQLNKFINTKNSEECLTYKVFNAFK